MSNAVRKITTKQYALMAVLAFFMPAIVLLTGYIVAGVAPFGEITPISDTTVGWFSDAAHLRNVFSQGGSFFYSFASGFGRDFYSSFASGMCSPGTFLIAIFAESELCTAYFVILMLRAAFSGLFCYLMLSPMEQTQPVAALAISVGYASGTALGIGFAAPGFGDAAVLLPLVGAGITSLVDRGGVVLLYTALALFFVCCTTLWPCCAVFALFFFLWRTMMYQERGRLLAQFALLLMCFAFAAGSAAVIGIPLLSTRVELGTAVTAYENADYASVFDALSGMFVGASSKQTGAVLFTSMLSVLMIPLYLFNSRFTVAERAVGMAALITSFAFAATPANWMLTAFASPTGTIAVSGIIFCAFAASMAARGFSRPAGIRVPIVVLSWTLTIVCYVCALLFSDESYTITATVFTFTFITLYAALVIAAGAGKRMTTGFAALLALCVACECAFGMYSEITALNHSYDLYEYSYLEKIHQDDTSLMGIIDSAEYNYGESPFFRVRGGESSSLNTLTHTTQGAQPACSSLLEVMGIRGENGFTPLTDAVFAVRYAVGQNGAYETVGNVDSVPVVRMEKILPLAFVASEQVLNLTGYSENPFEAQNQLLSAISGAQRNVFNAASIYSRAGNGVSLLELDGAMEITRYEEYGTLDYVVCAPCSGRMYMWYGCPYSDAETVTVNGVTAAVSEMNTIIPLGYFGAGDLVNISISVTKERFMLGNVYFASLDESLLDASIDEINAKQITFTEGIDGNIKLGTNLNAGEVIMTTIPYQTGWSIKDASGRSLESVCAAGVFIAAAPGEGSVAIELRYKPNDFTLSFVASILFVIFSLCATLVIEYRRNAAGVAPRVQQTVEADEFDGQLPPDQFPMFEPVGHEDADIVYQRKYVSVASEQPVYYYQPPVLQSADEPVEQPIAAMPPIPTQTQLPHPPAPMDPSVFDRLVGPGAQMFGDDDK